MKNLILVSSVLLLSTLSVGLFAPSSASAASDVDDVVRVVDELVLDNGTSTINISKDWLTRTEQALRDRGFNTSADSMMDTIGDPANSWAVIQSTENTIYVLWSTGKDTYFYFDPIYKVLRSSGQLCQTRELHINSELELEHSEFGVMCYDAPNIVWFGNNISSPGIFLLYYPITYPPGYAGSVIPDTYTPPATFKYDIQVNDKTLKLTDQSNNNISPTACYFNVTPNGTQNYTELIYDCNSKQTVTHTVDDYGLYDIVLIYVTPDGLKSSITTTLNIDGSTYSKTYNDHNEDLSNLDAFKNFFNIGEGTISAAILAPLDTLKKITTNNCNPMTIPFINNSSFTLSCSPPTLSPKMQILKTTVQSLMLGLTMYLIGIGIASKMKNITSPEDDRIEVFKL